VTERNENPLEYWEARLAAHSGPESVGCLPYGRRYNAWLYRVRRRRFRALVRSLRLSTPELAVLDVGSGTGFYVEQWLRLGARDITGADFSPTAVARLRARFPAHRFDCLDLGDAHAPLPTARYDVISAMDVLFHILDDARYRTALANLHRALRPGGVLLYSDNFVHRPVPAGTRQVSRSLAAIAAALDDTGFRLVRRVPMFVLMNYPVDTERRWPVRLWRHLIEPAKRSELWGFAVGALLFPVELALTAILPEGPTTEIAVCLKPGAPASRPSAP